MNRTSLFFSALFFHLLVLAPYQAAAQTMGAARAPVPVGSFGAAGGAAVNRLGDGLSILPVASLQARLIPSLPPSAALAPVLTAPAVAVDAAAPALAAPSTLKTAARSAAAPEKAAATSFPAFASLQGGKNAPTSAAKNPEAESSAAGADSVFDGRAGLPSYLSVADPKAAADIASLIAAAAASPTARRVLRRVKALVERRGRPVPVEIGRTQLGGEFDYDTGVVKVSRWQGKAVDGVPALIHELLHVAQKELRLPSDAFEMELEGYATDFRLDMELGLTGEPAGRDWDRKVIRRFRGDLDSFVDWLLKTSYSDNHSLLRSGVKAYRADLERLAKLERRALARQAALNSAQAALARMRADGQPESELRNYAAVEIAPRLEKRRQAAQYLSWLERDLSLLNDPASLRRYRDYSRRVMRLLRSTHAKYNAR